MVNYNDLSQIRNLSAADLSSVNGGYADEEGVRKAKITALCAGVGVLAGTAAIPIPFVGTLVGEGLGTIVGLAKLNIRARFYLLLVGTSKRG